MAKIKRKVKMNAQEFINWAWDHPEKVKGKAFTSIGCIEPSEIFFSVDGCGINTEDVLKNDIFEVEVEDEITKKTVIPQLLKIFRYDVDELNASVFDNCSIERAEAESQFKAISYHILDTDGSMTLIWENGAFV